MTGPVVCVVGSVNVDTTLRVGRLPGPGETVLADGRGVAHGGKGGNQAIAASGGPVVFVGAVGADDDGAAALRNLADRGVDVAGVVRDPERPTGIAVILVSGTGENEIVVDPGANAGLDPAWCAAQVRRAAPAVVLGQLEIPVASLAAAVREAPEATFVLNPAPMPADPATVTALVELADVLVPNRTELGQLVGRPTPTSDADVDACVAALEFAGTLVVTLGDEGAAAYRGGALLKRVPATAVAAVDTSGAGDAFCGALARHLAGGADVVDAVEGAVELAGLSTTHRGAQLPRDLVRA